MPNYYGQYQQPYQSQNGYFPNGSYQQAQQPITMPTQQIQNGGFVSVRSETEARNYPVRLGTSVTFKDETSPYIYTKTMGFSQLEAPVFDKYKLIKETPEVPIDPSELSDNAPQNNDGIVDTINILKREIGAINDEIDSIKNRLKSVPKSTARKSAKDLEVEDDE